MLGRMLAEWGDRPAGCLFLLPLWSPVLVAEQVGTLASIARGRFIMQCALGADARQFGAMGVNIKQRPSRFEQSLDVIRRLWAGQTVTSTGGRFAIQRGADLTSAARASGRMDRRQHRVRWTGAARLGEGYLAGPELTPENARRWAAFYLERCQAYGRTPSAVAIRRDVFVADSVQGRRQSSTPISRRRIPGDRPFGAGVWRHRRRCAGISRLRSDGLHGL